MLSCFLAKGRAYFCSLSLFYVAACFLTDDKSLPIAAGSVSVVVHYEDCLPDLLRDVGEEGESVLDPDESVEDFLLEVGGQLVDATGAPGVE
jgi:hypothetical protein